MTRHDEICREVCDVGQQRSVHDEICREVCDMGPQWSVGVKFLAHLPRNARRHQAHSSTLYKARDCLKGKHWQCPAFCWLRGKQLPPSAKSQQFPCMGEILALSVWDGNKWHRSICLFRAKQDLRVSSSSAQSWYRELFWLQRCFKAVLTAPGRDGASVTEADLQELCRTFFFWVFKGTIPA